MKAMIIGDGGREHAIAMAAHEAGAETVFNQANAGMEGLGICLDMPSFGAGITDKALANLAVEHQVDLAIIGPEGPLASGLADRFREQQIPTLGFGREAARLETSKVYANEFMDEFGIPKPATMVANNPEDALWFAKRRKPEDYVIKADGLAAGKGVILPKTKKEAQKVICQMMSGEMFGEAGQRLLLQERLSGEEVSMIAIFDGRNTKVLSLTQDYKRLKDKDKGPNTGGMGAYAPVPIEIASENQVEQMYDVLEKTLDGFNARNITDPGVIYIGFMLAEQFDGDPMVMEYNLRFGDPETQTQLSLLKDAGINAHELIYHAVMGEVSDDRISTVGQNVGRMAITVCLAAGGYPNQPQTGDPIYGLNRHYPGVTVHHGATVFRADEGHRVFTNGGRVAYVTAVGDSFEAAARQAYAAIGDSGIYFDNMQYRKDIGPREIRATS